jgi:hypothetical protein
MTQEEAVEVIETTDENEEELSPWYYFFSQGCGWCKKSSPIVEELIEDGHDILMLDLAEPDNQALNKELQEEYNVKCGTPWFINADTGKAICGFRDKDVLELWLKGEDIPVPPRPTGPPPKYPNQGATNKEEITWKKLYTEWLKDNEHMGAEWKKRQKSANEILESPRPKSDPPSPPVSPNATDAQIDDWGKLMTVWQEENSHLSGMTPVDKMVENIKERRNRVLSMQKGQADKMEQRLQKLENNTGGTSGNNSVNDVQINSLDARVQALEVKIDRIISHFGVK